MASAIEPGVILGGFHIDKFIGRGTMGEVYLATQVSMDREVALKILPPSITDDEMLVKRFLREVRMLAKVDHPNIVTAFAAGEECGIYYLAMSYVHGTPLNIILKEEGTLPEERALPIIRQVVLALSYGWDEHRILHNDIKPGNIMIDKSGTVKILDMGLSKRAFEESGLSMTGSTYGTPNYMSPEQACGAKDIDFRSDQFALGVTLYHLVTGKLPHEGTSIAEVISRKMFEPHRPVRETNPDVSEACEHLIEIMMAKNRESRYGSWSQLVEDLDLVLEGKTPETTRPDPSSTRFSDTVNSGDVFSRTLPVGLAPIDRKLAGKRKVRLSKKVTLTTLAACLLIGGIAFGAYHMLAPSSEPEDVEATAEAVAEVPAGLDDLELDGTESEEVLQVLYQRFALKPSEEEPPFDEDKLAMALNQLQLANMEQEDLQALYRINGPHITLDLSGNEKLTDIAALQGLPLKELYLHNTGVEDLAPLVGMSLEKLGLNATPVQDLGALKDLPLKELTLWNCTQLNDLSPLAGNETLEKLLIPEHCSDISRLRQLANLQYMNTKPDGWTQTASDFWATLDQAY